MESREDEVAEEGTWSGEGGPATSWEEVRVGGSRSRGATLCRPAVVGWSGPGVVVADEGVRGAPPRRRRMAGGRPGTTFFR